MCFLCEVWLCALIKSSGSLRELDPATASRIEGESSTRFLLRPIKLPDTSTRVSSEWLWFLLWQATRFWGIATSS